MTVDVRQNKDAARLHEMLCSWREQTAKLEAREISKEEYDRWRYRYPEMDGTCLLYTSLQKDLAVICPWEHL